MIHIFTSRCHKIIQNPDIKTTSGSWMFSRREVPGWSRYMMLVFVSPKGMIGAQKWNQLVFHDISNHLVLSGH